jgi:hypothetical protein
MHYEDYWQFSDIRIPDDGSVQNVGRSNLPMRSPLLSSHKFDYIVWKHASILCCLNIILLKFTSLSTIFQLYRIGQFYWWKTLWFENYHYSQCKINISCTFTFNFDVQCYTVRFLFNSNWLKHPLNSWYYKFHCEITFNNISVISYRSVLLVEDTGENHRPSASH